ncbi:unnamed protein product, partial [Rotaria sordida]
MKQDRYKHFDDDNNDDDDNLSTTTTNDSDSLFASFSSVSLKYVSELSGNSKQRYSPKQDNNDLILTKNVLRANSCTDSFSSNNSIQIDSTNNFQSLLMSKSMTNEKVESPTNQATFSSNTFEPLNVSSDESESSSKILNLSSSSLPSSEKMKNIDEKKTTTTTTTTLTKSYKQRKSSLKVLEKQNSFDSGDDNQQEKISYRQHKKIFEKQNSFDSGDDNQQEKISYRQHKKSRIPRILSPIKSQQTNLITPIVSISNENFQYSSSSSSYKPTKYNNQQQKSTYPRSPSKSFSSSSSSAASSPSPILYYNQDDRSYRQNYRHKMTVSPLERDTTLKIEKQSSPIHSITNSLRPPIIIRRDARSFGFTLRAVKVFHGNTDYYTTQHVVVAVQGPAAEAGLKPNDVITHVNEHPVSGLYHSDVVKLILSETEKLSIRAVPCSETQIRIGGRRRSPSKQKNRYQQQQQQTDRKISTTYNDNQSYCLKHRMNSFGNNNNNNNNNTLNNSNKKHQHNTSLFRRLSERKVA